MRETFAPALLDRKVRSIDKLETDDIPPPQRAERVDPVTLFLRAIVRPVKMLMFSPAVLILSLFNALVFGMIFLLYTTFPSVFNLQYGFSMGTSGLSYLGLGIGMLFGLVLFKVISEKVMKSLGGPSAAKPEDRLRPMMWFNPLIPAGFLIYGWSAHFQIHWIVPMLGTSLIGLGSLLVVVRDPPEKSMNALRMLIAYADAVTTVCC
jgi:hypothetical protein